MQRKKRKRKMPTNVVKTAREEHLWDKAKQIVRKQYTKVKEGSDRFYRLVMGIFKKMKGEKSMFESYPRLQDSLMKAKVAHQDVGTVKLPQTTHQQKKGKSLFGDAYPLLEKARVKTHQRQTKTGKVVQVAEHARTGPSKRVKNMISQLTQMPENKLRELQTLIRTKKKENYKKWQKATGASKKELEKEGENLDVADKLVIRAIHKKVFGKSIVITRQPAFA